MTKAEDGARPAQSQQDPAAAPELGVGDGALVQREDHAGIAILTISNPPVNALSRALRRELLAMVDAVETDPATRAVVLTGAGRVFVGGADITEFDRAPEEPHLPDLITAIETAKKPWIATLNGPALGGGAELAIGCHYRLMAPNALIGLPETTLGIIPGAGGTQRLPRLIGLELALDVICSGRKIGASEAVELGLAEASPEGDLLAAAIALAENVADRPITRGGVAPISDPGADFWNAAEARIKKAARGNPAPPAALAALKTGVLSGRDAGLALERQTFLRLRQSDEAAALRQLFFAERSATRPADLKGIAPASLSRIGVVGGGTMGSGIAAALANAGFAVTLSETSAATLAAGEARLQAIFAAQEKRGLHDAAGTTDRLARLSYTTGLQGLADCDLVIEAVFEDLEVKRAVFAELSRLCRPDAILATNTSYLNPEEIVAGLTGGERFIALHFFSPAQVMKLLEIVPLRNTSPAVLATAFVLAERMGKIPVRAGNCEGFIGNRILKRYRAEAEAMLCEGITPKEIDAAMRAFGFGMGPFEMQDMAGLDIAYRAREALRAKGEDLPLLPSDLLVRAGRLGQKSGAGWYDYQPGDRVPYPSLAVEALIAPMVQKHPGAGPEEIRTRLLGVMAAEGEAILAEGIAKRPVDIDLVEVHGYGFPRHKGGPMFQAALQRKTAAG